MAKTEKLKGVKIDDEEDNPYLITIISSDDEEANEDLSLKIVEKSKLKRISNESMVTNMVDLTSGSSRADEVEVADSKISKKKNKKKHRAEIDLENRAETIMITDEEERDESVKGVDVTEKEEISKAAQIAESEGNINNPVLRKLLRGPRYFDPPDSGWETCYNCGEQGHMTVNCPSATKRMKKCYVCGSLEHAGRHCTKGIDCFICKKSGHRAKDCQEKSKTHTTSDDICLRCGVSGHVMFSCTNNYTLDDLKEIQCYMCGKFGHLCCISSSASSPIIVSCYKCGQLGHTGLACGRGNGETTGKGSTSSCYNCGEEGHWARECVKSNRRKKNRGSQTPKPRNEKKDHSGFKSRGPKSHKEKKDHSGFRSAPLERVKSKRKKILSEERGVTTPRKSKKRGGWIPEDQEDIAHRNHWGSPSTPSNNGNHTIYSLNSADHRYQNSHSSADHRYHNSHSSRDRYRHHQSYSASRFSNYEDHHQSRRHHHDWW